MDRMPELWQNAAIRHGGPRSCARRMAGIVSDLTDQQKVWLEHYLICWNASEAARKAGYKQPSLSGHRNIRNDKIRAEIDARLREKKMSADEALARLSAYAASDMTDFLQVNKMSGEAYLDMQRARSAGKLFLVKKYKETKYGAEVELHDPMRALELIARHHGVLKDGTVLVLSPELIALMKRLNIDESAVVSEFRAILENIAAEADADDH